MHMTRVHVTSSDVGATDASATETSATDATDVSATDIHRDITSSHLNKVCAADYRSGIQGDPEV